MSNPNQRVKHRVALLEAHIEHLKLCVKSFRDTALLTSENEYVNKMVYRELDKVLFKVQIGLKKPEYVPVAAEMRQRAAPLVSVDVSANALGLDDADTLSDKDKLAAMSPEEQEKYWAEQMSQFN